MMCLIFVLLNKTHQHSTLVARDQDLGHKSTTKRAVVTKQQVSRLYRKADLLFTYFLFSPVNNANKLQKSERAELRGGKSEVLKKERAVSTHV